MPVKRKRNNLPFARKCHERSDMGCAQALSFDISILSCGNRFGVYSACLCTTVGQRYNSVEFTADSGRFPVFTELWVFCSLHNRGAMVSFRNDFCGLGAVSAAAQATPAAILLILGVILQNCGSLDAPCTLLFGWVNTGMLRAFAGILGGVVANRAASTLKKIDVGKKMAAMMTAVELAGYAWVLYHIWSMNETRAMLDGIVVLALGAAFTITASGKSLFYGKFDNGFVRFLGKATMPVFLSHLYCVQFLPNILAMYSVEVTELQRLVLSFACCAIAAGIVYYVGKIIDRQMKKSWHAFCTEIIAKNK